METKGARRKTTKRRNPAWAERLRVWVRSGGRCAVCGAYLLEGKLTHREFSLGELAHIVGQRATPDSPRGEFELPETERDRADNLMLVCAGEHDEIDRKGALDILTVEKLRKIKREHEDWIRRVTGLDKNRNTVVLRMIGKVRGNAVELTRPTASDAILRSDERYPDFPLTFEQQGIEIDLRHIPGEAVGAEEYWTGARAVIDEVIDHRLADGVSRERVDHISVFAFARVPLLVYLGSKLDDTYAVEIYQRHRNRETWEWPPDASAVRFTVTMPTEIASDEAVLILNVSGSIRIDEVPQELRALPTYLLQPDGVTPTTDVINSRESLATFLRSIRDLLSTIEAKHKDVQRLNVFAAVPICAGVALGRARDPHVHPGFVIYDRTASGYRSALEIS